MLHTPTSQQDLIALVGQWHQHATAWTPCGLGSRLHWGPPIKADPEQLSCRSLIRVSDHAVDDLTITVEAGLPLADLQATLAGHGQWFPVDWPRGTAAESPESAGSIGGLVARGLAGGLRQRHLGVRDQIIGIGLLRSDGTQARAGGRVVKNVAGYDLMRLLCGSWGSLALITELTLRVQPIRPAHGLLHLHGALTDLEACRASLLHSSLTPERCDWHGSIDGSWQLRLLVSSVSDQAVDTQLSRLEALAGQHRLDAERHPCNQPLTPGLSSDAMQWLVRVAVRPATLHRLLASSECTNLKAWRWDLAAGAGCGDGWQPSTAGSVSTAAQIKELRRRTEALGGRLTVLQQPKPGGNCVQAWGDAPAKAVMAAVKQQFDPQAQLSPGRLPGVAG